MAAIDIGGGASARGSYTANLYTYVDSNNPANDTGTLTSFELWIDVDGGNATGVIVGTFSGSGTSWDDRDYETIGNVTAGSKQTFSGLNCDVTTNDYIGIYTATGRFEKEETGGAGIGYYSGSAFGGGAQTYTWQTGRVISVYGTGATPEEFVPFKSFYHQILAQ